MQTADSDTQKRFKPKPLLAQANRWIGSIFHNAEVMNREVVALAEYRLIKEAQPHLSGEQVMAKVKKAVEDGHFNYSSTNRPRLLRSDFAKVLLQFKQYSQHMIYNLATGANATVRDLSKMLTGKERIEEEKRLRRQFVGQMGMHFLAAGALGLPLASVLFGTIDWVFGSDDEPYDSKTEFQNWLADTFGSTISSLVSKGIVDTATGLNLSSRVSLDSSLNPKLPITNTSIQQSIKATARNRRQTTRGVYLPESRSWMRSYGRFAE